MSTPPQRAELTPSRSPAERCCATSATRDPVSPHPGWPRPSAAVGGAGGAAGGPGHLPAWWTGRTWRPRACHAPRREVGLGICTIGPELERRGQALSEEGQVLEALIFDAFGSAAAEAAADALNTLLCAEARAEGPAGALPHQPWLRQLGRERPAGPVRPAAGSRAHGDPHGGDDDGAMQVGELRGAHGAGGRGAGLPARLRHLRHGELYLSRRPRSGVALPAECPGPAGFTRSHRQLTPPGRAARRDP